MNRLDEQGGIAGDWMLCKAESSRRHMVEATSVLPVLFFNANHCTIPSNFKAHEQLAAL